MSSDAEGRIQSLERKNRRLKLLAITGWLALLVACLLLGFFTLSQRRAALAQEREARMGAEEAPQRVEQERQRADEARQEALRQRDQTEKARKEAEEAKKRTELHLYSENIRLAQKERERGQTGKPK